VVADLQVQVGGAIFDSAAQQIIDIDGHVKVSPFKAVLDASMRL
jgi:hypothetical protein